MKAKSLKERSSWGESVIANAIGRIWMLIANIVMFPIYLRLLGLEHFGIVALLAAVTAIIALFDFGLTPVFARELNNQGRTAHNRLDLLHTAERVYLVIVGALAAAAALAPAAWLAAMVNEPAGSSSAVVEAIRWVFAVATAQLLLNFYVNAMSGIERQVQSNAVNVGTGVLRSVCVILPLWLAPSIDVFLWWQLGATLTGALLARHLVFAVLRPPIEGYRGRFSVVDLRASLPLARQSFLLALAATLNMNLDKVFLGRFEGLSSIGEYTIVTTFSQLIFIASVPITMAATPRMIRAITGGDLRAFEDLLTTTRTAVGVVTALLLVVFLGHGSGLIEHWSGSTVRAVQVRGYVGWLYLGAAALAVSSICHCVAIAHRDFTFGRLYVYSVLLVAPVYCYTILVHGAAGAAVAWGCTQVLVMLAYRAWIGRRLLRGGMKQVTPWAGLVTGALAALAAGALLAPWSAGSHLFAGALALAAAELALAALFSLVALALLVRRLDAHDGLAERADVWLRALFRRPTTP